MAATPGIGCRGGGGGGAQRARKGGEAGAVPGQCGQCAAPHVCGVGRGQGAGARPVRGKTKNSSENTLQLVFVLCWWLARAALPATPPPSPSYAAPPDVDAVSRTRARYHQEASGECVCGESEESEQTTFFTLFRTHPPFTHTASWKPPSPRPPSPSSTSPTSTPATPATRAAGRPTLGWTLFRLPLMAAPPSRGTGWCTPPWAPSSKPACTRWR